MSDVLLINPYYSQKKEYYSFYRPNEPLGLMYLASYLRKFKIESKIKVLGIFDIKKALLLKDRVRFGWSDKKITAMLEKEKPKIVGITSMYSIYYRDVMEIAATVKKYNKKVKVVIGGNHPSSYWNFVLKDKNIDFVAIGEGEETFLELCNTILKGIKDCKNIKGIAFRDGSKIHLTLPRPLIANLDDVPFPARDMIDYKTYLYEEQNPFQMRYPSAAIFTSRGCPGHCVYCTVRAVWGMTWRGRSPKNVVDEVEILVKKYGAKEIAFLDDSASVNKKRWNEICDEIILRKLNIKWTTPNGIAHWTLDKPTIKKMSEAGCYRITFGIESGNVETRKFLGKPYPLSQAKELLGYANSLGMWTICTNIIGFPYEKMDSIRDTVEFAKNSGTDFAAFYHLIPQPTSDVYYYFKKEKLLNFDHFFENLKINGDDFEKLNIILNETGADTVYFKKEELRDIQKKLYREFFLTRFFSYLKNPMRLLHKINSIEDLLYVLKLSKLGITLVLRTLDPRNIKSSDFIYKKESLKT